MAKIIDTDHLKTALEAVKTEIDGLDSKMSNTVGGYTWHMDTDKVYDRDGGEVGSLEECQTKDMTGTWFFARTSTSSTGSAAYPSKYTINGANGYLSLGDFVIWTGESLVHVSTYEAKASTVLNSDGQYSPKSGVDGMMSSTDKAYLTFLMEHYIAASMAGGFNSGNGTAESGLYGNVTLGRPAGSGDGDTYNMMSIRDKATNYTSQILINENDANPYAYFRGRISGAWQRILSDSDLISKLGVVENDSDYPNWDTDIRIYHVKKWAAATADRPNSSWPTDGDYLIVNIPGAPNATTLHARTQFVVSNSNMETWVRFIPAYSGTGSFANGSPTAWTKLSGGVSEVNGHTVKSDVPANAQFLSPRVLGVAMGDKAGVSLVDGAQVRIGDSSDGNIAKDSGLRFTGTVNREGTLAGLDGAKISVEMIPKDLIGTDTAPTVFDIATYQDDEKTIFTVAMTNLSTGNYNRVYTATPIVTADGAKCAGKSVSRSIFEVCAANLTEGGLDAKAKATLNAYVNAVGVRFGWNKESGQIVEGSNVTYYQYGKTYASEAEKPTFFDVSSTDNGDGSYKITVTPKGDAEIDATKFIDTFRINNANSTVKSATTEVTATDNKGLTFKFTPANANK